MDYIDFGDIQDAVLNCTYDDIAYGNEIINSLASRLKVTDIPEPPAPAAPASPDMGGMGMY